MGVILGVLDKSRTESELETELLRAAARLSQGKENTQFTAWHNRFLAFCWVPSEIDTLDKASQPFATWDQSIVSLFEGKLYNGPEIEAAIGSAYVFDKSRSGEALGYLYERYGKSFLHRVNGKFAFALWDERNQKLLLGRDRLGIEPLFYCNDGKRLVFSSSLRALLATGWVNKVLNYEAVLQYLAYCYNPGLETFLQGVTKLPAGHLLSIDGSGMSLKRYWRLNFGETQVRTEGQYRDEILGLMQDAIRICLDSHRSPGILLSGGTDSSTIVSLASRMSNEPLRTFSFRCEGRSYDESQYARLIAERHGTDHTEISYDPDHLTLITRAVQSMDEPFCDIGIEIGTYLLGQAAQGKVSYVFSGEGGDELFGGHPVYIADKFASVVDRFPRTLTGSLLDLLQKIPDSDQKKNFQVKLKRFAYSLSFPPELLSHRWRAYYMPRELQDLCTEDFLACCDVRQLFDGMLQYSGETGDWDPLSRRLYSDYFTLVNFYLRRLQLLHSFSIESRLPLLDYRLVEYAAKIPSRMKIRGISETKYIYKKILDGVLPREILYDRPKLGHSVPMKNWLRENAKLQKWVQEILSESSIVKRGFFRSSVVHQLFEEHLSMRHNHSHRLWGLVVLELWLRAWMDSRAPRSVSTNSETLQRCAVSVR
jgi:asparagine synthase (glutamine-hydrolysing)